MLSAVEATVDIVMIIFIIHYTVSDIFYSKRQNEIDSTGKNKASGKIKKGQF
jgi:hypothetical protein